MWNFKKNFSGLPPRTRFRGWKGKGKEMDRGMVERNGDRPPAIFGLHVAVPELMVTNTAIVVHDVLCTMYINS